MIRLARRGKRNQPFFRIVVSDKRKDLYGPAREIVGWYNPLAGAGAKVSLNEERIRYWLSHGAQSSPTVHNLLIDHKILVDTPKVKKKRPRARKEK